MPERPLLPLPRPTNVAAPAGRNVPSGIRFPSPKRQKERFGPAFTRLRNVLSRGDDAIQLRNDPTSLAPDRVVVFEIAGLVADFTKALRRIPGFELMAEYESEFVPDQDFTLTDTRVGREGQARTDKPIPNRFYLAMPDTRALGELVGLWETWQKTDRLEIGFAPFANLFKQLRALRPWGPQDRIPPETLTFWQEEVQRNPDRPIRTEVELWYHGDQTRRQQASGTLQAIVEDAGGTVVHQAVIGDIAYHGMLADIPIGEVQNLIAHRTVRLALADEVMFLRPQSMLTGPLEVEPGAGPPNPPGGANPVTGAPIAALLDGVPVQAHQLLDGRLILDDPDDLQAQTLVTRRVHGTAMSSLILHGDRNENHPSLSRPLYVRPVMMANEQGLEHTDADRLLVDTIYRAILRIKGAPGGDAAAPSVFLINLSMGDPRRPFTGFVSPLARLLDFLSARHNILFLVSGGNVLAALTVPSYTTWTEFENAMPEARERAVLDALNQAKHERTILSPAESLNALTIGAQHHDNVRQRQGAINTVDPFQDHTLPNVSSGLGLGHRRGIKPDLYFPGGREHVRLQRAGDQLMVATVRPRKLFGLSAAAPDPSGFGFLNQLALSDGTSSATALATRAAHQVFDSLMDRNGGSLLSDIDPQFWAVVVKALLVHSAAWHESSDLLKEICGPADGHRHIERGENSSRFTGYGVPNIGHVLECSASRATLVGFGALKVDFAHQFRLPLPGCLERVTEPRRLTTTIAWFSPVKAGNQKYRGVRLEVSPVGKSMEVFGVKRSSRQPPEPTIKRGSVFHEHFEGSAAVPYIDDGHLSLQVWCKEDAGIEPDEIVRYGIAVTIEAGEALSIYDEIQQRLQIRLRP